MSKTAKSQVFEINKHRFYKQINKKRNTVFFSEQLLLTPEI